MTGFVLIHRAAFEHPLLRNGDRFRAWFWLVSNAAWKPTRFDIGGRIVTLQRGQICASRSQMAEAWGWSESAVERFLTRLKTEQMISRETGQGKSVITICNYEKYQAAQDQTGQAPKQPTGQRSDSDRTAKEQGNKGTKERTLLEDSPLSPRVSATRARRCPPDWQPKPLPHDLADAVAHKPSGWLERQLAAMRDWSAASPKGAKMDWDATWRGWLRREIERTPNDGNGMAQQRGAGPRQYRQQPGWDGLQRLAAEVERNGWG